MMTIPLSSGDAIPAFGLGTWKSDPEVVYDAVVEAIKVGYRHIDCAAIYCNEEEIGRALKDVISQGVVTRDDLWVTSKLWNNSHAPDDVSPALEKTLHDLQLDYLDLYLIHWPVHQKKEFFFPEGDDIFVAYDEIPIIDTWGVMEGLVREGKLKTIGVSNFNLTKLRKLLDTVEIKPVNNQVEGHPYLQQRELLEFCESEGVAVTAYSPMGSPDRPAQMKACDEKSLLKNEVIVSVAERNGISAGQVLITWAIQRGTAVIPKSANPGRIIQNIEASRMTLSDGDMAAIAALDNGYRYVKGDFWERSDSPYTMDWLWNE